MPTYEYQCQACEHIFEKFQPISAEPVKDCPHCHKPRVKRLISGGAGLIFKGGGFYTTDYRSDSYQAASKSESKSGSDSSASDSKKPSSDSKAPSPSTKTESKPAGTGK